MRFWSSLLILCIGLVFGQAPAHAWTLQDTGGKMLSQADFHGRWLLVNFWAPWCQPCRQEIPDLVYLAHDAPHGLSIIGIAVSYRSPQSVTTFVHQYHMNYPIVLGEVGMAAEFGGLTGLPTSFLYGPDGKLVRRLEGPQTERSIKQAMVAANH